MSFNRKEMVEKRRCVECLFVRKLCICERIAAISKNISQPDLDNYNTEVWIFMRVDEFGSTSNTGRLLPMILPKHTKLFIFGIKAHEKALLDHIKAAENPVVLYPSENAMPVAEYVAKQQSEAAAKAGVEQSENTSARKRPKVTMIVLEGTWSKVKPMQRFIPKEVPRVILAPDAINDKRSVRRESRSGGCATLEAILAGLRQLEEPQSILTAIGDGFDTLLNGALRQGNLIGDKGEFRGVHHQHMADFHEESQRKKLKLSSETESVSEAKSADTQTAEIATGNETVPSESVTESKLDAVPADTTK
ncbi:hypothetical protein SARC_04572 [Sphaeroforma arctica JP610]|uniref:tRNA-uridine aminocarboxypropyltransferase n=1 Tax=Sphaeroforma arctica JP610 TaxID=667725 RepID=A0A0L0G2X6_9EUKA|nr:hypothetical protein SARC_04572 [Sphaeroforma arctica JP610]KNC83166.1 hypothetical protein SARC_04572 [Sphaeroforma arctica JP610]|eukprot:XP_014157068.1 hypothetical protein SARC_04572 [Sphaeroforma arctica JP610]